jgi:hypothetical protein
MKLNRFLLLVLLCSVALLETGCQWARWLRLLSFKKQLAQVERYVRVEDQGGLMLHFVKPVVYCDDLSLLIDDETLRTTNKDRVTWIWTYEKQSADGTNAGSPATDLSISMGFKDLKFDEMKFPEPFLALMPKPLIIGLLRSVGQAEIDIRHGNVKMKWVGPSPGQKVELPTKTQVTTLLGPPYWITQSNLARTYLYKYYQKLSKPAPPAERLAWAKFTFADDGEEISSSEGIIGNVGWKMTRVPNQPEPRVTFSLEDLSIEPVAIHLPSELTEDFVGVYKEPGGTTLKLGRDGDVFIVSWEKEQSGGWCMAQPETTNAFFGLPNGLPRGTFLRDNCGVVTGLVAQLQGPGTVFAKVAPQLPAAPSMAAVDAKIYADCAGRYKASWGGTVTLIRGGDQLFWKNQGIRARVPIYPSSETNFFFKAVDSPLTFVRNSQGQVTKFVLRYCGHQAEAVKIAGSQPNSS